MNENFDITYKALFRRYYPNLIFYATRLVGEEEAEDVVQDVFVELWKRKDTIEIGDQIQAFLYRAVYTRALNVLKHRNVEDGYCAAMEEINQRRAEFYQPDNNEVIRRIEDRELRKEIYDSRCPRGFTTHDRSTYVQGTEVLTQSSRSSLDHYSLIFVQVS